MVNYSYTPLLCRGIEQVYADTYPIPEFYDPDHIAGAIAAGRLYSVVAMEGAGEVVGCMSTVLEQVGDYTADGSALMISPDYRGPVRAVFSPPERQLSEASISVVPKIQLESLIR